MKKLLFIDDTLENKISYYHLAFFLISLPFDFFYSEVVLTSFAIHTLIHLRKYRLHLEYLDFEVLSFQVPMELSALQTAAVVIAKTTKARLILVRMCDCPLELS